MHSSNLIRDRSNLIEWCLFMLVAIASMHCAWAVNGFDPYEFLRRGSDQLGYYQWLPAFFVDQDFGKMYWCHQMESGKWISMFTFGVALLQLPFFLFGQLSAEAFGYDLNGFSPPYAIAQMVGVALYTGAGVVLAYRIARRFSTEESALLAVVALFAATNLFYYSVYAPTMSHGYSFFLVSFLLFRVALLGWSGEPGAIDPRCAFGPQWVPVGLRSAAEHHRIHLPVADGVQINGGVPWLPAHAYGP